MTGLDEKTIRDVEEDSGLTEITCSDDNFGDFCRDVLGLIIDKKKTDATEKMVDYIKQHEHIFTTRDDEKSEVWIYKDGIYVPEGRTYIRQHVRNILGKSYTVFLCNQVLSKVETDTYIDQSDFFKEGSPDTIAVKNGLLNVKNGTLSDFTPEQRFFNKISVTYNPSARCPKISNFFRTVLGNEDDVSVMEEVIGYLLYNEMFIEKAIMFSGKGRNGKSKTLMLMKEFIGSENVAEVPLEDLENDQWSLSELFKKKANLCGDISKTALKRTGNFKKLLGRDWLGASRKFLNKAYFQNYAKMVFSANEMPITYDATPAFWNRWVMIDFPFQFDTPERIQAITDDKERERFKVANPEIIADITSPEEMSGLLNLALLGLKRLFEKNDFSKTNTEEEIKRKWRMRSNSFLAFMLDNVVTDPSAFVTKEELRKTYAEFCQHNRIRSISDKFIKDLLETECGAGEERKTVGGEFLRCWVGIRLKEQEKKEFEITSLSMKTYFSNSIGKNANSPIELKSSVKVDRSDKNDDLSFKDVIENLRKRQFSIPEGTEEQALAAALNMGLVQEVTPNRFIFV